MATNSEPLTWRSDVPLEDWTVLELYDVMKLRVGVFNVEQKCIYKDLDDLDKECLNVLGTDSTNAVQAYARVLPPKAKDESQFRPMIGRVVIAPEARGSGQARVLTGKGHQDLSRALATVGHRSWSAGLLREILLEFEIPNDIRAIHVLYVEDGVKLIDMQRSPECNLHRLLNMSYAHTAHTAHT